MIGRLIIGDVARPEDMVWASAGEYLPRDARRVVEQLERRAETVTILTNHPAIIHECEQAWKFRNVGNWQKRVFVRSKTGVTRPLVSSRRANGEKFTMNWLARFALVDLYLHHALDHLLEDA